MAKGLPKKIGLGFAFAALLWDLQQADNHQRTCPQCAGRDYLAVLDVAHLAQA